MNNLRTNVSLLAFEGVYMYVHVRYFILCLIVEEEFL